MNNAILYNAVIAGAAGGVHTRWITDTEAGDYVSIRNRIILFATAVDSAIAADPTVDAIDALLLGNIVQQVLAGRYLQGTPTDEEISLAIAALYSAMRAAMQGGPEQWATQAAWELDATNGNDQNSGAPGSPLRTIAELQRRFNLTAFEQAVTVTVIGNCVDTPFCFLNVLKTTITFIGTTTVEKTATITVVTSLAPVTAATIPWQLTTTGVAWAAGDVGKRVTLASGHSAFIQEVLGANDIVTGAFVNAAGTAVNPTAQALNVDVLPTFPLPGVNGTAFGVAQFVEFQALDFVNTFAGTIFNPNVRTNYRNCRFTKASGSAFNFGQACTMTGCGLIGTGALTARGLLNISGGFTSVGGSITFVGTQMAMAAASFSNCPVRFTASVNSSLNVIRFRNTAAPIKLDARASVVGTGTVEGNAAGGNTGVGITVAGGSLYQYISAGSKPTLTGASDTTIGTTARTYAQIPYTDLQTDAAPNTVTTLIGQPSAMILQAAI